MASFSVIVPVYNIEKYLEQCLNSIMLQTFGDLEIILVDDGSTDRSPLICDKYAMSDKRIHVIHKENGGLVSARKAGARIATAEYIACIDGDDWIEADYFEKFADAIKEFAPDIACCGMIAQSSDGHSSYKKEKEPFGYYTKEDLEQIVYPHLFEFSGNIWGKVFKRDLLLDVQLDVDDRIKIGEDSCVVIPCVYKAENMFILEDCLYSYRYNPSSMTKNKSVFNLEEPKLIARHMEKYLDLKRGFFRQQIYISTIHRLFNRCVTQFYQKKEYRQICSFINDCIDDNYYQECIRKSKISLLHSPKEWLARQALKNKWYRLMDIYSKVR